MNQNNSQNILQSRELIAELDKSNMISSIEMLDKQIEHAWSDTRSINLSQIGEVRNVVVAGMGGSGLGADVIKTLFKEELTVPLEIVHDYHLPNFVNQNSLVFLASYSGNTEEILSCAEDAKQKNAQIIVICAGGKLEEFARQNQYPMYLIDAKYNPSDQPRMAIGYAVFGMIAMLDKVGLIQLTDEHVSSIAKTIKDSVEMSKVEVDQDENPAKALAFTMLDRRSVIVASEFLEGAAHVATNQLNENAKIFADYKVVPELNHHLMEGLKFPKSNSSTHVFLLVQSHLYRAENSLRMQLTQQVIEDNEVDTMMINLRSKTKIEQVFEMIVLFSYAGFYLSMLEGIDPSPIPFVESFKEKLKEKSQQLSPSP